MMRDELAGARRVVVKVGSSSLTTAEGGIDPRRIEQLVGVLASARLAGREIVLVSSGAIAAGLSPLGLRIRPRDLATQQAAASVGQGLLMGYYTQLFNAMRTTRLPRMKSDSVTMIDSLRWWRISSTPTR